MLVHKSVLLVSGPFFVAALNNSSQFLEATTQIIQFPDDAVGSFEDLVEWLYQTDEVYIDPELLFGSRKRDTEWDRLASLYVLADKLGMTALKRQIITRIFQALKARLLGGPPCIVPNPVSVNLIYSKTPDDCGFRRILIAISAYQGSASILSRPQRRIEITKSTNIFADLLQAVFRRCEGQPSPFSANAKVDQFLDKEPEKGTEGATEKA